MAWSTIATPVTATAISTSAFGIPVAANLNIAGAAWTAYTPVLTGSTTNPTGYTTTGSAWLQIGKIVHVRIVITMAATTGSGTYSLTLPISATTNEQSLKGLITDTGTGWYSLHCRANGTTGLQLLCDPLTAGAILRPVTNVAPMTFAVNDVINIEGTYEAI